MASGSSYPGTLDSWVDKLAGDYLTIADVNSRTSAIEKLETGPLRLNDGSAASPAYAFRSSASSGMLYASGSTTIAFAIGGFLSAAIIKSASPVNYIAIASANTLTGPQLIATGTDTNIDLILQTKGTGGLIFSLGGTTKGIIDSSGRFLVGHSVQTGSGAGDIILGSQHSLRSVIAAGTNTAQMLGLDGSDRLLIGGAGVADILWGPALVTMGGGGSATMGSIGGSGPTVTTQNSWMRVRDSTGALFWVPAWK